jgi:hypothetical protein
MKYLIWIIGLGIIGGTIYFTFFDRSEYTPPTNNQIETKEDDAIVEDTPNIGGPTDEEKPTTNTDLSDADIVDENPNLDIPIDENLKTFTSTRFAFAFDFNKNYYWNATKNDYSIDITNSEELAPNLYSYQGYIPDTSKEFRVGFEAKNIGSQTLEQYASKYLPINESGREVETFSFQARNITGKEYFIHALTSQPVSGVNYNERFVLFKKGNYIYQFFIDGNDTLRDTIISSFRTI